MEVSSNVVRDLNLSQSKLERDGWQEFSEDKVEFCLCWESKGKLQAVSPNKSNTFFAFRYRALITVDLILCYRAT